MGQTNIEWTERTWNPVNGCTKVSKGCQNCYAETMAKRLQAMGTSGYENGFAVTIVPKRLNEPKKIQKPTTFFVGSMGDIFHKEIPTEYINEILKTIKETKQHRYLFLTKRANRMKDYFNTHNIPDNVWLGVSIETRKHINRLELLKNTNAKVKFLSLEPLLEDLGTLELKGIDWVIVGGETGSKARRMHKSWVENIQIQCELKGIPFFFKQWGMYGEDGVKRSKKANGCTLDGKKYRQYPKSMNYLTL